MARDRTRGLQWNKAKRPVTSNMNRLGSPSKQEGADGDIQLRSSSIGAKLWAKIGGEWLGNILYNTGRNITLDTTKDVNIKGKKMTLDVLSGNFLAKNNGTQFSVANSAYAGMILGYTTIGIDAADDSYAVTNSFVVVSDDHKVKFVAPPSGAVEIEVFIYSDGASARPLYFGLSDASATTGYSPIDFPNSNDVTNEHEVHHNAGAEEVAINHQWVVTGLTAGTAYEWWLGAACSHNSAYVLRWGGNVTVEYAPFIMKATALPTAVTDFAVYG